MGRTRTSAAWTLAAIGLLLALLMLVFILQNGHDVDFEFLWFDFTLPAGGAMLLAAVVGGLLVVLIGVSRVIQLRWAARRHRRSHAAGAATAASPTDPTDPTDPTE
jgi:uncharacterized integral membrane protein